MADVSPASDPARGPDSGRAPDSDDRGQLFLVAALSLAMLFVTLALLLNTAIYTENLASRSNDASTEAVIEYQDAVDDALGGIVHRVNRINNSSYTALETAYVAERGNWSNLSVLHRAIHGRTAYVEGVSVTRGTRIVQDVDRNFTRAGGHSNLYDNWSVASNARVRNFTVEVIAGSLTGENTSVDTESEYRRSDYFRIRVDDGSFRRVYVFQDDTTSDVHVVVDNDATGSLTACSPAAPDGDGTVTLNLSAGTVGGTRCGALDFFDDLNGDYTVEYREAVVPAADSSVKGTYSLVTDEDYLSVADVNIDGDPAPYKTWALYAVTVDVHYRSAEVRLSTPLRVLPGESDA